MNQMLPSLNMIAPVYEQNAAGRTVYLPESMKMLRFAGNEVTEERILPSGHHFITVPLDGVVIFIRKGHILPLSSGGEKAGDIDWNDLKLYHYAEPGTSYEMYDDDGTSRKVELEKGIRRITV